MGSKVLPGSAVFKGYLPQLCSGERLLKARKEPVIDHDSIHRLAILRTQVEDQVEATEFDFAAENLAAVENGKH